MSNMSIDIDKTIATAMQVITDPVSFLQGHAPIWWFSGSPHLCGNHGGSYGSNSFCFSHCGFG